jgi:hypothetical protein
MNKLVFHNPLERIEAVAADDATGRDATMVVLMEATEKIVDETLISNRSLPVLRWV